MLWSPGKNQRQQRILLSNADWFSTSVSSMMNVLQSHSFLLDLLVVGNDRNSILGKYTIERDPGIQFARNIFCPWCSPVGVGGYFVSLRFPGALTFASSVGDTCWVVVTVILLSRIRRKAPWERLASTTSCICIFQRPLIQIFWYFAGECRTCSTTGRKKPTLIHSRITRFLYFEYPFRCT